MDDLIAKLETATEPSRELDADLMRSAFNAEVWSYDDNDHIDSQIRNGVWKGKKEDHPDYEAEPLVTWRFRRGGAPGTDPRAEYGELPTYTASIDAAQRLVPEGCAWQVGCETDFTPVAKVWGHEIHADEFASTPAIALCIAALKARQSLTAGQTT